MDTKQIILDWMENRGFAMQHIDSGYDIYIENDTINYRSGTTFYNGSLWDSNWNSYIMTTKEAEELNFLVSNN